jgi:hypothetical protein
MSSPTIDQAATLIATAAKYGPDLLAATTPEGADDTLRAARNVLARIRSSPFGSQMAAVVSGLVDADHGTSADLDALRGALQDALTQDADLASDLAIILSELPV